MHRSIITLPSKIKTRMIESKLNLRPIKYTNAFELFKTLSQNPWYPTEVNMAKDVKDWELATEAERSVIGSLLRGFTLAESIIGDNWTEVIATMIPIAELNLLFKLFGQQEGIHAWAYDHLEATLGIDSYTAFESDKTAQKKIEHILTKHYNPYDAGLHLAVFGGAIEGVSLYSSFGILLSFNRMNKFEGLGAIISWSALDEAVHSKLAIDLFHQFTKSGDFERPKPVDIYAAFDIIVNNEIDFVNHAFGDVDHLPSIDKIEALEYIKYRANVKLKELEYEPHYVVDESKIKRIKSFFNSTVEGSVSHDFFAVQNNGSSYTAAVKRDYDSINVNLVDKLLKY